MLFWLAINISDKVSVTCVFSRCRAVGDYYKYEMTAMSQDPEWSTIAW
jgi:hypothetical protein